MYNFAVACTSSMRSSDNTWINEPQYSSTLLRNFLPWKSNICLHVSIETAACISRHLSGRLAQTIQPKSLRTISH